VVDHQDAVPSRVGRRPSWIEPRVSLAGKVGDAPGVAYTTKTRMRSFITIGVTSGQLRSYSWPAAREPRMGPGSAGEPPRAEVECRGVGQQGGVHLAPPGDAGVPDFLLVVREFVVVAAAPPRRPGRARTPRQGRREGRVGAGSDRNQQSRRESSDGARCHLPR
jgi:hypothetical protein